jgi:nucleoside-triphosphatase
MVSDAPGRTKVLITGTPGCGKTTLVERLMSQLDMQVCGFITKEIRENKRRIGFRIDGVSGCSETLAHTCIRSRHRVGKYGVDLAALDRIVESEFSGDLAPLVVVDEIGKMELFSERFRDTIGKLWQSTQIVVATIMSAPNAFCDRLKADKNTMTYRLNQKNRDEVFSEVGNFVNSVAVIQEKKN